MDEPIDSGNDPSDVTDSRESSRLQMVLDVLVFQFKLAADGLRDVLLVPLSLLSGLLGLIAGGDDPYRYYRKLLRFGRRTEIWINLFGQRKHGGTSDELIAPLKHRVVTEAQTNPLFSRAGAGLNRTLDNVEGKIRSTNPGASESKD